MNNENECINNEAERAKVLREAFDRPIEDDIFDLVQDFENRLHAKGIQFSRGLNPVIMGDVENTMTNQAKVRLGWMKMMLAMEYPLEGEFVDACSAKL